MFPLNLSSFDNATNCCQNPLTSGQIPLLQAQTGANHIFAVQYYFSGIDYRYVLNAITGNPSLVFSSIPNSYAAIAQMILAWVDAFFELSKYYELICRDLQKC